METGLDHRFVALKVFKFVMAKVLLHDRIQGLEYFTEQDGLVIVIGHAL